MESKRRKGKKQNRDIHSQGMSEVSTEVLIIGLILVLAVVIYVLVFGNFNPAYMKKTVYVGATASTYDIPRSSGLTDHIIMLLPKSGDRFYLNGQQTPDTGGVKTSLRLLTPDGYSVPATTSSLSGTLYGRQLYIYPNNSGSATMCDYDVSTTVPPANLRPMSTGTWKIQLIDEEQHILANSLDVYMRDGSPSLPTAGGFATALFRSDCSPYLQTLFGPIQNFTNGPGNMLYTHFNGFNTYLSIADDPGLSLTGDMAISLWLRPTATGSSSNTNNWHQIIGKGSIDASNNEVDNYQLFQIGDKLVFEWNDAVTNTHYQAITSSPALNTDWNYVTASVSNGQLKLYNNGIEQPLAYSQGLDPRYINTPSSFPGVRLKATSNPVTVGKQNGPAGSSFYYSGDIGAMSLYNRALTPEEIAQNYAGYRA